MAGGGRRVAASEAAAFSPLRSDVLGEGQDAGVRMRDVELFHMALGLESPWYVERTEFDADARRLDLYLDFRKGGRFRCAECGAGGCPAHDTSEKTWRHRNFF